MQDSTGAVPSSDDVKNGAEKAGNTAQDGVAKGGEGVQGITGKLPVVGDVTKGLGETPIAQKIAGKEGADGEKGYLGAAMESVGNAVSSHLC